MKDVFDFVKNEILNGMPAGMLVTLKTPTFDIGNWQFKTYDSNQCIKSTLKSKWTSTLINIMFIDESISFDQLKNFMDENDFKKYGRQTYLIYCFVMKNECVTENIKKLLISTDININRFSTIIIHNEYSIFINDFIKDILYI